MCISTDFSSVLVPEEFGAHNGLRELTLTAQDGTNAQPSVLFGGFCFCCGPMALVVSAPGLAWFWPRPQASCFVVLMGSRQFVPGAQTKPGLGPKQPGQWGQNKMETAICLPFLALPCLA